MHKMDKPIKSKPVLYAVCLPELQRIAIEHGYNLVVHGSLNRDLDLICIAWTDEPSNRIVLLDAFVEFLGAKKSRNPKDIEKSYHHSKLAGGRDSHIIHLNYGFDSLGEHTDDIWYLDISFTPCIK